MREIIELEGGDLAGKTCKAFFGIIKEVPAESVVVSLPGGTSIQDFFMKIPEHAGMITAEEWKRVHFFWSDERLAGPDDKDSNFKIANELFLKEMGRRKLLLEENVHRFRGEAEDVEEEIARYDDELGEISEGSIHLPILGVGPDGHTASLFPEHELLKAERREFLHIDDSPKPPSGRVTLSPRHITESHAPFIFFVGDKREAYERFMEGGDPTEYPCRLARQGEGKVYVIKELP